MNHDLDASLLQHAHFHIWKTRVKLYIVFERKHYILRHFKTKPNSIHGTHFIDLGKMKGWVNPVVLNTGHLD